MTSAPRHHGRSAPASPGTFLSATLIAVLLATAPLTAAVPHAGTVVDPTAVAPFAAAMTAADPQPASIAALARQIRSAHRSDMDRARAVYEWVARNVAYDVASYMAGGAGDMSAAAVFVRRTAICEGYANLFIDLAQRVGLRAEKVSGYAKGFDHTPGRSAADPNHAWVTFRIGRNWHLADPTWGAGYINGFTFKPAYTPWYFDVAPEALILSHLPEEPRWQLLRRTMSRRDFEQMAQVPVGLLAIGFPVAEVRTAAADRQHAGFPAAFVIDPGISVLVAPLSSRLEAERSYDFELFWPTGQELFVVVGEKWTRLEPIGEGRFRGAAVSGEGTMMIVGRKAGEGAEYETVLVYGSG
jgi:hypothetical protein